jgi:hypothetical protein
LGEGGSNETNAIQIASRIICKVQAWFIPPPIDKH